MYIFNAILRLECWPKSLKIAQIIMIPKPGKKPMDVSSYRPISLLPTISKVLEKLILRKISKDLNPQDWIPNHQFGSRQAHSTAQQCHRITDVIKKAMDKRQYCTAAFLDVSQAFDKVWHPGLLFKIKRILLSNYFNLLKSYLNERQFETKFMRKLQAASTSIPVYPKGAFLVLFSTYYTYLTYQRPRKLH